MGAVSGNFGSVPNPPNCFVVGLEHVHEDAIERGIGIHDPRIREWTDAGAGGQFLLSSGKRARDLLEHTAHAIRRYVIGAGNDVPVDRQKGRRRKTTDLITLADVRPPVRIDANRHERRLDEGDHARLAVGGAIHLVAPVTPGC